MKTCSIKFTVSDDDSQLTMDYDQGDFNKLEVLGLLDLFKASLTLEAKHKKPTSKDKKQ